MPQRLLLFMATLLLAGCFAVQAHPTLRDRNLSLHPGELQTHGVAFITPSAASGQEGEKQALAFIFSDALRQNRPAMRVVDPAGSLSAINRSGLADVCRCMYDDYRDTGLLKRDLLEQIGKATGTRYIAQIKLQEFRQGSKERFGAFGFRTIETRYAGRCSDPWTDAPSAPSHHDSRLPA